MVLGVSADLGTIINNEIHKDGHHYERISVFIVVCVRAIMSQMQVREKYSMSKSRQDRCN